MALTHSLVTSGFVSSPNGGWVQTAEVAPTALGSAALVLVVSTLTSSGFPGIPSVSGLDLTWVLIGTQIDEELVQLGSPHMRLAVFAALGGDVEPGRVLMDFSGADQFQTSWTLTRHESESLIVPMTPGAPVFDNTWSTTQFGVQLPYVPSSVFTAIGWTGSGTPAVPSGYTLLASVTGGGSQSVRTAVGTDPHPVWTGVGLSAQAVVVGFGVEAGAPSPFVGGHLRQKQRSSEQDALRATAGRGRNSYQ